MRKYTINAENILKIEIAYKAYQSVMTYTVETPIKRALCGCNTK